MEEIEKLITGVGFPIACCVVLFFNNQKFTEALNQLNVTMTNIVNRLEQIEDKIKDNK